MVITATDAERRLKQVRTAVGRARTKLRPLAEMTVKRVDGRVIETVSRRLQDALGDLSSAVKLLEMLT